MAVQKTVYDHIASNNLKTLLLVLAMPVLLLIITYFLMVLVFMNSPENWQIAADMLKRVGLPVAGIALVWGLVSYFVGDKMMLGFAGAQLAPNDDKHKKIYRAVENVSIAAGLPMPKVYLIEDDSLNAFATGHSPQTASVALTTGIVAKLEPLELEAVIAHEMGHIGNRDIRLNMVIVTGLGVCAMLAEILFRVGSSEGRSKDEGAAKVAVFVIGIALLIFNLIVAPIIRMAISRTREYAADATAAYITRNPAALASALRKISQDARVEVLDESKNMAHACIYDPLDPERMAFFGSTHPPIEKRIERLNQMAGLFSLKG
ncbi:MAG: M48 family metallopeptidase [Alphaproteobacteria bacterium]|nr:M48 family metallopeptidase [Alphaproteobacteria bacterium]